MKTKYRELPFGKRIFKDEEIEDQLKTNKNLIPGLQSALEQIVESRLHHSRLGNVLEYIENNDIRIPGFKYIRTGVSGGYWTYDDK